MACFAPAATPRRQNLSQPHSTLRAGFPGGVFVTAPRESSVTKLEQAPRRSGRQGALTAARRGPSVAPRSFRLAGDSSVTDDSEGLETGGPPRWRLGGNPLVDVQNGDVLTQQQLDRFHADGFVLVPDVVTGDELATLQEAVWQNVPSPDQYFADPTAYTHLTDNPFAGLTNFPWASP